MANLYEKYILKKAHIWTGKLSEVFPNVSTVNAWPRHFLCLDFAFDLFPDMPFFRHRFLVQT